MRHSIGSRKPRTSPLGSPYSGLLCLLAPAGRRTLGGWLSNCSKSTSKGIKPPRRSTAVRSGIHRISSACDRDQSGIGNPTGCGRGEKHLFHQTQLPVLYGLARPRRMSAVLQLAVYETLVPRHSLSRWRSDGWWFDGRRQLCALPHLSNAKRAICRWSPCIRCADSRESGY